MAAKQRIEHHFDEQGKPEGIVVTTERVKYLGGLLYGLSSLEFWKSAAVTTWVGIVLFVGWWLVHNHH